ncbi:ABC transporter substrate-binding protein [Pusillimonas sp. ANT_WB101]|uniref:ABC transporter substrate-binding protein n=1 Tax=Pusillimonas sp. ANT_WB101 TaxID=2597356 RepID=UPI0011ED7765|nr:ABC transporter substrate-binding protein [Pusillimonas sp. ANT_WB101]KAA0910542.1 ABC transporter substrate-binding protein [Pusillimonas sp. ANT_WB101]
MSNPRRLIKLALAGLFSMSAVLASGAHAEQTANVKKGGTLTVLSNSAINSLNPAIQSGAATAVPGSQLFVSLVIADDKWQFQPYLADSWEASEDGKTYTFHLNKDAIFHDDKPITSEDVAFSVKTVAENHPFGKAMYANLESVETPDAHTVVVKFAKPNPAFLLEVSTPALLPILPKHIYAEGSIRTNPYNNKPIGSGPFKFADYKAGEYLTLERFDKFFKGPANLDKITVVIIADRNAATLALQRGNIQYAAYPPLRLADIDRLGKNPNLIVSQKGYEGAGALVWMEYNLVKEGPLQNVKVRQAISYAIDRKFVTEKLQSNHTKPIFGPLHPSSPFYDKDLNEYGLDLDKANKLLDEAGYPKKDDGTRFDITLDYIPTGPDTSKTVAEYLRPQLAKIGVKVELRPSPDFPTWARRISNFDYDMNIDVVFNWGDPIIGVERSYMSTNIRKGVVWANMSGYDNPKVDEILTQAAVENNPEKRKALYQEFQKITNEELPVAWLTTYPGNTVYSKKLVNVPEGIWGAFAPFNEMGWAK